MVRGRFEKSTSKEASAEKAMQRLMKKTLENRADESEEAAELEIRSTLLIGLEHWLASSGMTQAKAAEMLGITRARVSDIKRGRINQFTLDLLIRLAARAGLQPTLRLVAYASD